MTDKGGRRLSRVNTGCEEDQLFLLICTQVVYRVGGEKVRVKKQKRENDRWLVNNNGASI